MGGEDVTKPRMGKSWGCVQDNPDFLTSQIPKHNHGTPDKKIIPVPEEKYIPWPIRTNISRSILQLFWPQEHTKNPNKKGKIEDLFKSCSLCSLLPRKKGFWSREIEFSSIFIQKLQRQSVGNIKQDMTQSWSAQNLIYLRFFWVFFFPMLAISRLKFLSAHPINKRKLRLKEKAFGIVEMLPCFPYFISGYLKWHLGQD